MATYTKITKDISTYNKIDKSDFGWLVCGYLLYGWLTGDIHTKIDKEVSTYTKVDK